MTNAMDETTASTKQVTEGGVGVVAGQRWRWTRDELVAFQRCLGVWFEAGDVDEQGLRRIAACSAGCRDHTTLPEAFFANGECTLLDAAPLGVAGRECSIDNVHWTGCVDLGCCHPWSRIGVNAKPEDSVVRTPRSIQRDAISSGTPDKREAGEAGAAAIAATLAPSPATKPRLREVAGGGDWINYDALIDPDPFEKYRLRREDGMIIVAAAVTSVRIVGEYDGFVSGAKGDGIIADRMEIYYNRTDSRVDVEPTPEQQSAESHCLQAGIGIWRTR